MHGPRPLVTGGWQWVVNREREMMLLAAGAPCSLATSSPPILVYVQSFSRVEIQDELQMP